MRSQSRRHFMLLSIAQTGLLTAVGCGTIFHPERKGQPAGPLDWKIVALDAVGLLLFFVPGVIAFAVDFNNGSIYLPPDQYGWNRSKRKRQKLVTVNLPDKKINVRKLEEVVSHHTGRDVRLTAGGYQTEKLDDIDQFWTITDKLESV